MSHGLFRRFVFSMIFAMLSATAGHAMAADGESGTTVESSQSVQSVQSTQSEDGESVVVESSTVVHSENGVTVVEESHTTTSDSANTESIVYTNGQAGVSGDDFGASSEDPSGNLELAPDLVLEDLIQHLIEILILDLVS